MKIPETPANVGAYYGNEENGQWQPNGVILESGIGSGDAGVHRTPVYPVHIPRGHIPSYVMAGAYYPPAYPAGPPPQDDFADYMWMENEDEFDKQVMQQLEEEALMEQCIEAMLEDEQRERQRPTPNGHNHYPTSSNGGASISLEEAVSRSTLNPLAAEFVPSFGVRQTVTEEKTEPAEAKSEVTENREECHTKSESPPSTDKEPSRTEEPVPASTDPPEVSAADVQPIDDKKPKKDVKKLEAKKPAKPEPKAKTKPVVARVDNKPQKKKEVKAKSEEEEVVQADDTTPSPAEESTPAFKPINYAAAAKANKPKKPTTPPATDKTAPPPALDKTAPTPKIDVKPKTEKTDKKPTPKDKLKTDKPAAPQRKNSAK